MEREEARQETQQSTLAVPTGIIGIDREDPGDLERAFTARAFSLPPTFIGPILTEQSHSFFLFFAENDVEPPSPSQSMFSDFHMSSPPSSPSRRDNSGAVASSSPKSCAMWRCPFCSMFTSRSCIACISCVVQYSLDEAQSVWFDADSHPGGQDRQVTCSLLADCRAYSHLIFFLPSDHVPLATKTPSESGVGVVMLCGARECDWCFAL